MKKLIVMASAVFLLAAGCNQQTPTQAPSPPTPNPSPAPTPAQPTPAPQSSSYENQYMRITVAPGWTATEATQNVQSGNCVNKQNCATTTATAPNPAAVNIINGNYTLYINTQSSQASGIQGGRFAEIAMGSPSADAVVTIEPGECGTSVKQPALQDNGRTDVRVDLYAGPTDKRDGCSVPSNGSTVWFFSYITDQNGGYFNYPTGGGSIGYVITMSYNSKDINSLPVKGSAELTSMLNTMTQMVQGLQIKQQ